MSNIEDTTSFVIRFTQKMYQDEAGETQVQWRGNIRHVQGGDEQRFADFGKAIEFIQTKLAELTLQAMENKPVEEHEGILTKSLDLWKKVTLDTPKMVIKSMLDPKGQVEQWQSQIRDAVGQKLESEIDQWRSASKSDFKQLLEAMHEMSGEIKRLQAKVDQLSTSTS